MLQGIVGFIPAYAQRHTPAIAQQHAVSTDKSLAEIRDIFTYFHTPANVVQIQVASDKTLYAWQNMSAFQYTMQIDRDGPISALPEKIDPKIGQIKFTRPGKKPETVDQHFAASNMDSLLVLHKGNVVYERYKTMRPFDKHQWFSCSKVVPGTMVELLALEGKIDLKKPVSDYVPELKGSGWDKVTVEETLDMATGLDSTEHEEPNDDARVNPIRGWYKWAVSIGLYEDKDHLNQSPYDVLRNMKKVKPGHTAFEYNSINPFVLELIVNQVTGRTLNEVFGERVWRKIGAQNDAFVGVTKYGLGNGWGFVNSTLRDIHAELEQGQQGADHSRLAHRGDPAWRETGDLSQRLCRQGNAGILPGHEGPGQPLPVGHRISRWRLLQSRRRRAGNLHLTISRHRCRVVLHRQATGRNIGARHRKEFRDVSGPRGDD